MCCCSCFHCIYSFFILSPYYIYQCHAGVERQNREIAVILLAITARALEIAGVGDMQQRGTESELHTPVTGEDGVPPASEPRAEERALRAPAAKTEEANILDVEPTDDGSGADEAAGERKALPTAYLRGHCPQLPLLVAEAEGIVGSGEAHAVSAVKDSLATQ